MPKLGELKKMRRSGLILMILLGFFANVRGQKNVPTSAETINEFWNLVLSDKIEDAVNKYFDKKHFRKLGSAVAELESIKIKQSAVIKISTVEIADDVVTVHVNVKDKSENESYFSFYMYRQTATGDWKIVDFFRRLSDPDLILKPAPKLTDPPLKFVLDCLKCT